MRRDYAGDARVIARKLIGRLLVRTLDDGTVLAGRIVETEAYQGAIDRASHAYGGRRTRRNEAMYAAPGTAYVYFTYGMHFCFNVVCGELNAPLAVLVRALEPVAGVEKMRELRKPGGRRIAAGDGSGTASKGVPDTQLCSGPAKLCQAMDIDRNLNGVDMVREKRLFIAEPGRSMADLDVRLGRIIRTPRIGVDYAGEWAARPLRFVVDRHPHASRARTSTQRRGLGQS